MPKKKNPRNGFYFFMQDLIPELQREGRYTNIQNLVPIAHPRWKALPPEEKERYERRAKDEKKTTPGGATKNDDRHRLDNIGNIIADRTNRDDEATKRRQKESRITKSRWPQGKDALKEHRFYFIGVEYLCRTEDGHYLPVEIGIVEFSMKDGITRTYHRFVAPGSIPLGYRFQCKQHSEDTHQIPDGPFELATDDYRSLYLSMEAFINPTANIDLPPIYCFGTDMECVEYCLNWIHFQARTGHVNRINKVFEIETLTCDLVEVGRDIRPDRSTILEVLSATTFDYEPNTRCKFHEEKEVKYCAMYTANRFAYTLSDLLADMFKYEQTLRHRPEPSAGPAYVEITPSIVVKPINYNKPRPSSQSDSSFGGRDYRMTINPQDDSDSDTGSEFQDMELSQQLRRPHLPSGTTAPWGMPSAQKAAPPTDNAAWPTLGGGRGILSADQASIASSNSWTPVPGALTMAQRAAQNRGPAQPAPAGMMHQPYVEHNVPKAAPAKPTLGQAVAQQRAQNNRPTLSQAVQHQKRSSSPAGQGGSSWRQGSDDSAPSSGRSSPARPLGAPRPVTTGWAPKAAPPAKSDAGAPRAVNSGGWGPKAAANGLGLGDAPRGRGRGGPGPAGVPVSRGRGTWTPTSARSESGDSVRPGLGGPRAVNAWGRGQPTSLQQPGIPNHGADTINTGPGRGRGLWKPGGGTAVSKPPGLGSSVLSQMSSLSVRDDVSIASSALEQEIEDELDDDFS